jgi:hypothetical protein
MSKKRLPKHQQRLKELRIANKHIDELKAESAVIAVKTLYVMLLYTMYYYYGWKKKRLSRISKQFERIFRAVINQERSIEGFRREILDETGVDADVFCEM